LFTALNDIVDYDADDEDNEWLQKQLPIHNLTVNKLERYIEFLEDNCNNKVPTMEDFASYFHLQSSSEALGKVYDYWLDKRLEKFGEKLVHRHKTAPKKPIKNKQPDPYEAFRPCMEKMRLRKNRHVDRDNYEKMFQLRMYIASDVEKYKNELMESCTRREIIKNRFHNFKDQFQRQEFNDSYLDQQPIIDKDQIECDIERKKEDDEMTVPCRGEEVSLESVLQPQYKRKTYSEYHEVSKIKLVIKFI
jgi:hypothetical protein